MEKDKKILYVGLDDSNHGNYPEVCLAYFSTIKEDIYVRETTVKRDLTFRSRLQSPKRDYNFLLLEEANIGNGKNNLAIAAPSLIIPHIGQVGPFERLEIFIDGRLKSIDKEQIQKGLSRYANEIQIKGVIKNKKRIQGKEVKRYQQPFLLILADLQANYIYTEFSLEQLHNHPKRVFFQS